MNPAFVQINPQDAEALGIADQQLVWVSSRRGKVISRANYNERINLGAVYMTYQWWIGACKRADSGEFGPDLQNAGNQILRGKTGGN
ncbi:Formate dehydrogenase H [Serratia quinivorans]|uniref:Formate dehydrogenase H n=1 Tax=Serratia quinivorans TaxID=137545 RepID=A0A380B1N6_9GAMM|nr:Formate dehydrogenase H [Serratia quinivorans]